MKIDLSKLRKYKKEGWLKSQVHPSLPLTIWNYTPETQYQGKWWDVHTRKETAQYVNTCQYPSLMFNILDGNNNSDPIWDMVKPDFEKGFSI